METVNQIVSGAFAQLGKLWKILLFVYVSILSFFVVLDMISRASDRITLSYFTRDITSIGHLPFFAGLVSQLGGLFWAATLAVCIFTLSILKKEHPAARRFLFQAAILTAILLFDDFFLFHEDIGPDYLGISERIIVLAYGLFAVFFLLSNFSEILASEYLILGLALVLFGLSIVMDASHLEHVEQLNGVFNEQSSTFLEDGFKFVGVVTWLVYFSRYAYQKVTSINHGS